MSISLSDIFPGARERKHCLPGVLYFNQPSYTRFIFNRIFLSEKNKFSTECRGLVCSKFISIFLIVITDVKVQISSSKIRPKIALELYKGRCYEGLEQLDKKLAHQSLLMIKPLIESCTFKRFNIILRCISAVKRRCVTGNFWGNSGTIAQSACFLFLERIIFTLSPLCLKYVSGQGLHAGELCLWLSRVVLEMAKNLDRLFLKKTCAYLILVHCVLCFGDWKHLRDVFAWHLEHEIERNWVETAKNDNVLSFIQR